MLKDAAVSSETSPVTDQVGVKSEGALVVPSYTLVKPVFVRVGVSVFAAIVTGALATLNAGSW